MSHPTQSEYVELLYKKYSGVVDASPGSAVPQEPPVSARPRVIPALQIWTQAIPATAPSEEI